MADDPNVEAIAQWMYAELEATGRLSQSMARQKIRADFGEAYLYKNRNRNSAIREDILARFRELTLGPVVWVRRSRAWRKRRAEDPLGSRQVRF